MKRRDFVKNTTLASSLFFVPSFVKAFDDLLTKTTGYKRLVIVQLSGGNDGLNTIVPYRNDIYYRSRPKIAIRPKDVIKLNDELGLHTSLMPLKRLYDKGFLTIINNVGYPNPDRSHFRSTDIWQTASSANQQLQTGWIGRYLDAFGEEPYNAIEVDDSLSLTLKGNRLNGIATNDAKRLYRASQEPFIKSVLNHYDDQHLSEHNLGYLYKTTLEAQSSAKYIYETSRTTRSNQRYTKSGFGNQLKTTAQFINSGLKTKVYYTSLKGFDTHVRQPGAQARLLKIYAENMETFVNDLIQKNTFEDTLILTFSEFGRRVEQNAADGTDHGAANNIFVIGKNLKNNGIYNPLASLNDLDDNGDIKFEIDFRTIYATVLNKWLNVDESLVLNGSFNSLNFI